MAAQDGAAGFAGHTSDADYLAGLADRTTRRRPRGTPGRQPSTRPPHRPEPQQSRRPGTRSVRPASQQDPAAGPATAVPAATRSSPPTASSTTRTATPSRTATRTRPAAGPSTPTQQQPTRYGYGQQQPGQLRRSSRSTTSRHRPAALDETSLFDTSMIDLEQAATSGVTSRARLTPAGARIGPSSGTRPVSWLFGRAYVRDHGCPLRTERAAPTAIERKQEALNARLDHRNPLVFDTHELGRRPGAHEAALPLGGGPQGPRHRGSSGCRTARRWSWTSAWSRSWKGCLSQAPPVHRSRGSA